MSPARTLLPALALAILIGGMMPTYGADGAPATLNALPRQNKVAANHTSTNFWAFQQPVRPAMPQVKNRSWPTTPMDRFILAGLERKGLAPAPPADKPTLLRRATFDLH